jgi:hypothetical protein
MNERYKELIKYQTEILRVLFIIFFADMTGMISLFRKGNLTTYEWKLIFTGLLIIFGVTIIIYKLDREVRSEIIKLR